MPPILGLWLKEAEKLLKKLLLPKQYELLVITLPLTPWGLNENHLIIYSFVFAYNMKKKTNKQRDKYMLYIIYIFVFI